MSKALPISALLEALADTLSPEEIMTAKCQSSVAAQLSNYRAKLKMNQAEFANHMGVSQGTVSKWENGDFNFTIGKLAEIACALNLDLSISLRNPNVRSASIGNETTYSSNVLSFTDYKSASISANSPRHYKQFSSIQEG